MPVYQGSCHCGDVRFSIDADIVELTTCDCSLCSRKNALMTQVPERNFKLIDGHDHLSEYRWNTRVARHFFCSTCGIYTFHRKRSLPDHYGVNVRCLEDFDVSGVPVRAAEGAGMTLVEEGAREAWPGPRIKAET
jgi:hypothetical protein